MKRTALDGESLVILIRRMNMTQTDLAEKSEVSRNTISLICRGLSSCRAETAEKIAAALDVPVEKLTKKTR